MNFNENYMTMEPGGIGRMLVFLAVQGVVYFVIVFMIELNVFKNLMYRCIEPSDQKVQFYLEIKLL